MDGWFNEVVNIAPAKELHIARSQSRDLVNLCTKVYHQSGAGSCTF